MDVFNYEFSPKNCTYNRPQPPPSIQFTIQSTTDAIGYGMRSWQRRQTSHEKKSTGYVMHQQFNIQQLYALPTLYLRVLYLSENKQQLVPLQHKPMGFITEMKSVYCAVRTGYLNKAVCASYLTF